MGALAGLAAPADAALVSACAGVSLPTSALNGIVNPLLNGGPLSLLGLGGLLFSDTTIQLSADIIGPSANACDATADTLTATTVNATTVNTSLLNADTVVSNSYSITPAVNKGISIGGNAITGLGTGVTADAGGLGSIAIGNGSTTAATATNATAIGNGAVVGADALRAVALGSTAQANGVSGVAIGDAAISGATGQNVAIGSGASANAATAAGGAVAIGRGNIALGDGAVAIGDPSVANGQGAIALGFDSIATADGTAGGAAANGAVALGNTAIAGGQGAVSIGNTTSAVGTSAVAVGDAATASAAGGVAIGAGAATSVANAVALGQGTTIIAAPTGAGYNTATVAPASQVAIGGRRIEGVSGGAAPTDAVNVGQLAGVAGNITSVLGGSFDAAGVYTPPTYTTANGTTATTVQGALSNQTAGITNVGNATATVLGGGATYDPATGSIAAPGYTVGGTTYANVGAAIAAQDAIGGAQGTSAAANLGGGAVYDPATGTVSAPTFTVQGAPYTSVGTALGALDTATTGNTTAITNITAGTTGTVQRGTTAGTLVLTAPAGTAAVPGAPQILGNVADGVAATDAATVGQIASVGAVAGNSVQYNTVGGVRTNAITLAGGTAGAPVTIDNVAAGSLAAGSLNAVNGGQLNAGLASVATGLGGGAAFNPATGAVTAPAYTVQGTTYTDVGAALAGLDTGTTANTTAVTTLSTTINAGTAGTVQRGPAANALVLTAPGGTGAAPGAPQTLGNVAAGVAATDAANVGQVAAVGAQAANSVQYDTVGGARANSVTLAGGAAGPVTVTNVAAGALTPTSTDAVNGAQLAATNGQVTTNTANIAGNATAITNLATGLDTGSVGLVRQTGGAPGSGQITVGAATGGTSVSIAGTDGTRTLTGLSGGLAGTDAVTVAQVNGITGGALNAVQYDAAPDGGRSNTITLTGVTPAPVRIANVADAALTAASTDAVNGRQLAATNAQVAAAATGLAATNAQVAANTGNIVTNTATINSILTGQAGAFQSNNAAGAAAPVASGLNATAGGFGSSATGARGLALGNGAVSTGTGSVALGAGSTDGGAAGVVSVGSVGGERRITNVGPAVSGTDAVNLSQLQAATTQFGTALTGVQQSIAGVAFDLNRFKKRANAGTAGAMAVAGLPQAFTPGEGMVAGAVGNWQDQFAFAVGASKIVSDRTVVKAGASFSTRGTGGFNAGVGVQF